MVDKKEYPAPECCGRFMELKGVMQISYTFGRFFQCKKCGKVNEFQSNS